MFLIFSTTLFLALTESYHLEVWSQLCQGSGTVEAKICSWASSLSPRWTTPPSHLAMINPAVGLNWRIRLQ